jgi:hypothetical protein
MKIEWNDDQVELVIKTLEAVDKKSYDAVYGNLVPRIELKDVEGYKESVVVLEEFEIFSIVEALNEILDERESYLRGGDIMDEDIHLIDELVSDISTKYGIAL